MRYFPDGEIYNMLSEDGGALYLAHCDLEPIKLLIELTNISLNIAVKHFSNEELIAAEIGDMQMASDAMEMQGIFVSRVSELNYEAILLILVSRLEEALNCWCRTVHPICSDGKTFEKYSFESKGGNLEKAASYLEKCVGILGIKKDVAWEKITAIRDIRNAIVHNGGIIKKHSKKIKKFYFITREEDNKIYIEYDILKNIYDK